MSRLSSGEIGQHWREYQITELKKFGVENLKIAFPGSLLCNHILVPASNKTPVDIVELTLPDISHVIYDYCDGKDRDPLLENSVVVDIDGDMDEESVVRIMEKNLKKMDICRIVLLGKSTYSCYNECMVANFGNSVDVQMIEPDWMSASAMHSIYRQAAHTLFINSMRILDASITGCKSSLVVDQGFQQAPAFPVLYRTVKSQHCEIYDDTGAPVTVESSALWAYSLVENSAASVTKAIKSTAQLSLSTSSGENLSDPTEQDWFVNLNTASSPPVIKPYRSSKDKVLSGLRDKKTGVERKLIKLRNNPAAFFVDSKYSVLRIVGRVFKARRVDS